MTMKRGNTSQKINGTPGWMMRGHPNSFLYAEYLIKGKNDTFILTGFILMKCHKILLGMF